MPASILAKAARRPAPRRVVSRSLCRLPKTETHTRDGDALMSHWEAMQRAMDQTHSLRD